MLDHVAPTPSFAFGATALASDLQRTLELVNAAVGHRQPETIPGLVVDEFWLAVPPLRPTVDQFCT